MDGRAPTPVPLCLLNHEPWVAHHEFGVIIVTEAAGGCVGVCFKQGGGSLTKKKVSVHYLVQFWVGFEAGPEGVCWRYAGFACTSEPHDFCHCAFQTHPYRVSKNTGTGIVGAEVWVFGAARQNPIYVWHCAFQKHPYWVSKNNFAGIFDAELGAFGAPRQNTTISGMVRFKRTHTSPPRTQAMSFHGWQHLDNGLDSIREINVS